MDQPKPSESGAAWSSGDVASGWQRGTAAREQALAPVNALMFDLASVSTGMRLLDLGAGTGDQTVQAAQRVGPAGSVLVTDISAPMLDLARAAARAAKVDTIETRVMDAQHLDLPSASFDAAIARFSLQFVPDVQRALLEVRRVLKPGGKFAAVVFSAVEQNAFRAAPQAIASRLAGRAVPFVYRFASLADALRNLQESQPPLMRLLDQLSEADRAAAWDEINRTFAAFEDPNGFAGPAEALVAVGAA